MVIEVDMYKDIKQSFINREFQRDIAKRLGIARQTVKKYCEGYSHPAVRKPHVSLPDTITEDVKGFILSCFNEDKEHGIKKQKHTAKRIYRKKKKEKGSGLNNYLITKGYIVTFIKSGLASAVMGVVAYMTYNGIYGFLGVSRFYNLISLLVAVGLGVIVYGVLCYVFKVEEVRDVVHKIGGKFGLW